ncbi:MAG: patatin-like phospholipase family protein [Leptospirales bacterium]
MFGKHNKPIISLNLGGGGTRGLAHIGVLKALHENKIEFDLIIGVSMGAIIGLNYALDPDPVSVEKKILNHLSSSEFRDTLLGSWRQADKKTGRNLLLRINRVYKQTGLIGRLLLTKGVLSEEDIEAALFPIIPDVQFSSLKKPFICTAVNLTKGAISVFKEGSTRNPVLASASMPLVFPPVFIGGDPHSDGGVLDKIGIETAHSVGVKSIIAVDVSNNQGWKRKIATGIDVMIRADEISAVYRKNNQLKKANIIINPIKEDVHWADYSSAKTIIDSGYESTIEMIPEIRKKIKKIKTRFFFFR